MIKKTSIFLVFIALLLSCEKSEIIIDDDPIIINDDPNYPTKIYKKSTIELKQMNADFFRLNPFITTSMDEFGFFQRYQSRELDFPPVLDILTEDEVLELIKDFIDKNSMYMRIKNSMDLNSSRPRFSETANGTSRWFLSISPQILDSLEVRGSKFIFVIKNREVVECLGRWYPDTYIPKKFNVSQEKAKSLLLNKFVNYYSFAESKEVRISSELLDDSNYKLIIFPLNIDDRIELRLAWHIYFFGPYSSLYVDVMTGELLHNLQWP